MSNLTYVHSSNRFGAINTQRPNFGGHVTFATTPFRKLLRVMSRLNMHVKFEHHSFNRFKLVCLNGPLHAHTHTDTQRDALSCESPGVGTLTKIALLGSTTYWILLKICRKIINFLWKCTKSGCMHAVMLYGQNNLRHI